MQLDVSYVKIKSNRVVPTWHLLIKYIEFIQIRDDVSARANDLIISNEQNMFAYVRIIPRVVRNKGYLKAFRLRRLKYIRDADICTLSRL